MRKLTMTELRNASLRSALLRECERSRRTGVKSTERDMLRRALSAPVADGYFVGVEHAVKMVGRMRRNGPPEHMRPERREMWAEIAAKVAGRRKATGSCEADAVADVLSGATASRYFISEASAEKLMRGVLRKEVAR